MSDFGVFGDGEERDRVQARAAADALIDIVERHEEEDHDGGICRVERAGMVAFVAHCLGLRPAAMRDVEVFLRGYEETHEHNHGGRSFND